MRTRRQLLGAALGMAAVGPLALAGCDDDGGSDGAGTLGVTWWGNPLRNERTDKAIAVYTEAHPDVTIQPLPGDWASYWDRLAVQVAAGDAPDVIQMSTHHISEYGARGALLDLGELVDTTKFSDGTVDPGMVDGKLVGITMGMATVGVMANPKVFDAAGVDLPDDTTWTWDDYREICAEITAKSGGKAHGSQGSFGIPGSLNPLQAWLRQNGADLFTAEGGLAFTADDVVPYFEYLLGLAEAKAIPEASVIAESQGLTFDQSRFVQGKQGLAWYSSNQLSALEKAAGTDLEMLRFPSTSGKATDRQSWFVPTMLWSVSAASENAEAAAAFVDWWVNSVEVGEISLDERGLPPNADVVKAITDKLDDGGKQVVAFVEDTSDELGAPPALVPPGGGTLEQTAMRHVTDLLFERASAADTAKAFVDEATSSLA